MKVDSKPLSTADLASAGTTSPADPIADPMADEAKASSAGEPRDVDPARNAGADKQEITLREVQPASERRSAARLPGEQTANGSEPLFDERDADGLRGRWNDIQVGFVDEPRAAVQKADTLVAETIKRLADSFATSRRDLEGQWDREGDVSTETLRVALQRYRSFFNRLLSI